jgi:hypothetical protein
MKKLQYRKWKTFVQKEYAITHIYILKSYLNSLKPVGFVCTICFNTLKFCVLPAE